MSKKVKEQKIYNSNEKIKPHDHEFIDKGWGYEKIIANSKDYCGKLLSLHRGKQTSIHSHFNKLETMLLHSGLVEIHFFDPEFHIDLKDDYNIVELHPGESITIERGDVHRIYAKADSELYEFSTFHEDSDSIKFLRGD